MGQKGFFDVERRLEAISAKGDPGGIRARNVKSLARHAHALSCRHPVALVGHCTPQDMRRLSGLVNVGTITDEPRAAVRALKNDPAPMKGGEIRAMTNADNGRFLEFAAQELHQLILAG
jgi:hypothetical protein